MYASALASNKKYSFACLLPQHLEGEYWTDVEKGISKALSTYSDFNTTVKTTYYDPYDYQSFVMQVTLYSTASDGVMVAPTVREYTRIFTPDN